MIELIIFFFIEQILPSLGLFAVVEFPNDECTTALDANVKGICMNSDECTTRGGTSDGNCASGFGTCCRIKQVIVKLRVLKTYSR